MANTVKYTGETITATLGNLANGNHLAYSYFKSNSLLISGLSNKTYTAFVGSTTGEHSIVSSNSESSSTVTLTAYPQWDNGYYGYTCTSKVDIRQATQFRSGLLDPYSSSENASAYMWVGETTRVSYTLTSPAYNKGVTISVQEGGVSSYTKAASDSSYTLTVVGKKSGESQVNFTPNTTRGNYTNGSGKIFVFQPIKGIYCPGNTIINVARGGNATIKLCILGDFQNQNNDYGKIHHKVLYHSFTGQAEGSTSTSARIEVKEGSPVESTNATTFSIRNITKSGTLTFAALSGSPLVANAAIPSGSSLTQTITINISQISIKLYKDKNCTIEKTENSINAGDYFFIKATSNYELTDTSNNTVGSIGNFYNSNSSINISITDIGASSKSKLSKVTVPSNATGSFTIKFISVDGGTPIDTTITIKPTTLTLS